MTTNQAERFMDSFPGARRRKQTSGSVNKQVESTNCESCCEAWPGRFLSSPSSQVYNVRPAKSLWHCSAALRAVLLGSFDLASLQMWLGL